MDEREKIAQLLCKQTGSNENRECETCPFNGCIAQRQADALIAANIGDVTEWKERAEKHRVIALPGGRIKQLYSDEEVEQIVKERDSKEEAYNKCYFDYRYWKDKAKEYKHRAEVAERALRKAVSVLDAEYRAFGVNRENKTEQRIKNFIEQAEKELAEEEK